jgi:CRISPR type III-B/RAMP module-associated protein Cmr3
VLEDVLCGGEPGNPGHQTLFKTEVRPGLAIDDETGRAADQMLFSRPYRRFEPGSPDPRHGSLGAGFEAWYETREHFSEPPTPAIGFLGGDRRRARFTWQETPEPLVEVREAVLAALEEQAAETQGFLLYLVTPMIAVDDLAAVSVAVAGRIYEPVCAAIGKPAYASGWDTKWNRPRPILALVPAGSVFFYRWGSGERPSPEGLIDQLWLTAISPHGGSVGFGRVLVGVW